MYGQSEATARIAYVPPHDVAGHVRTRSGSPIPGGSLDIDLRPDRPGGPVDVGEIVYRGAERDDRLRHRTSRSRPRSRRSTSCGRVISADTIGRRRRLAIIGRRARLVKPFGSADRPRRRRAADWPNRGFAVTVAGDDDRLVVAMHRARRPGCGRPSAGRRDRAAPSTACRCSIGPSLARSRQGRLAGDHARRLPCTRPAERGPVPPASRAAERSSRRCGVRERCSAGETSTRPPRSSRWAATR